MLQALAARRTMNFVENLVLKENYSFVVADEDGMITGGEHGLYNRDTRFLSLYRWRWGVGGEAVAAAGR